MAILIEENVPRTLEQLMDRLRNDSLRGALVEAWLFEGAPARRAAERHLAARGIEARLRSAYKPLVHFFLEDVTVSKLRRATVRYPVHELAHPRRFVIEAYPLAAMLSEIETRFLPGDSTLSYRVELEDRHGAATAHEVPCPCRIREDHLGTRALSPAGWLRITGSRNGSLDVDQPLPTEFETIFDQLIAAVGAYPWASHEPFFDRLVIRADIPEAEQRLPYGEECVSTFEALHEDVYFSLLELFEHRAGRPTGDRTAQPGQIVPDVRRAEGTPRVRVTLERADEAVPSQPSLPAEPVELETAEKMLSPAQISEELAKLGGQRFSATSRQGRTVAGVYRTGERPAVLITAGQHANEPSGIVGALRAAHRLAARPGTHFALIPLENPDGYALDRWLCAQHPRHMHHAARYTALGDDLQARSREPWYEKAARLRARQLSGAALHVNLHGYPSHEWTRPFCGYLPRGFEPWSIPKGFFLIVRHHPRWGERAAAFLARLAERLGDVPGLAAFNRTQLEVYRAHAGEPSFPVRHGIPCQITEDEHALMPLVLITEFPDETIYGDLFVFAHTVQMEAVIAAEEIHAGLEPAAG